MKMPSIIFCIYHLFSINLSTDLKIKTQRVKVCEHEKRWRPANVKNICQGAEANNLLPETAPTPNLSCTA